MDQLGSGRVRTCSCCGQPEDFPADPGSEIRPYGPGGSDICYRCGTSAEHVDETARNFGTVLDGATAAGGGVAVLTDEGPAPFDGKL